MPTINNDEAYAEDRCFATVQQDEYILVKSDKLAELWARLDLLEEECKKLKEELDDEG